MGGHMYTLPDALDEAPVSARVVSLLLRAPMYCHCRGPPRHARVHDLVDVDLGDAQPDLYGEGDV